MAIIDGSYKMPKPVKTKRKRIPHNERKMT
jgi:hypothetical protein